MTTFDGRSAVRAGLAVEVIEKLYEAEIPGSIDWLFDGGFEWELLLFSDTRQIGEAASATECARDMANRAAAAFPDSPFAQWWRRAGGN